MNILLAIKPDYAAAILAGTKTVELRSYLPAKLHPGDTIYLVGRGRIWGHCTFAGSTPMPPPGACREHWLESIATPAAVPVSVARQYLTGSPRHSTTGAAAGSPLSRRRHRPKTERHSATRAAAGYAWHVRYPVSYGSQGRKYDGATVQRFAYTPDTPAPAETHPRLANYLLYLKNHKTP